MLKKLLKLLEILADLDGLLLFLYAGLLCWRMSGGYESGWSAGYCLPRILAAAAGVAVMCILSSWANVQLDKIEEAEARAATLSGLEPRDTKWEGKAG